MRLGLVVALACASGNAIGCGGAPGKRSGRETRGYAPLAFAAEAADAKRAVILAAAPAVPAAPGAPSAASSQAVVLPLRLEGRKELAVARGKLVARAAARIATNHEPAAPPAPLAASAWIAAEAAARLLGKNVEAYDWQVLGDADVAAEAALAAAFLACLTGAELRADVAVIGSVLPDGSLGISPGLPESVAALAAAGKKRIGVAAGVLAAPARDGRRVPLAPRAAGAELVPLSDVAAAYALLTGEPLPEAIPESLPALALPPAAQASLERAYAAWQERIGGILSGLFLLDNEPRLPPQIAQLATSAQLELRLAENLRRDGKWPLALDRLEAAWVKSATVMSVFQIVGHTANRRVPQAATLVREALGQASPILALTKVSEAQAKSTNTQLLHLAFAAQALAALARAQALLPERTRAAAELETSAGATDESIRRVVQAVEPILTASHRVLADAEAVLLALEISDDAGGPARALDDLARAIPEASAQRWRALTPTRAFAPDMFDSAAPLTSLLETLPLPLVELRERWGERSTPWQLLRWGLATATLDRAAADRAFRDDLVPELDLPENASGRLALLATAERHARQAAARSRAALGAIPLAQLLSYQLGAQLAHHDDPLLQRRALLTLWRSSALGDAALRLARATYTTPN